MMGSKLLHQRYIRTLVGGRFIRAVRRMVDIRKMGGENRAKEARGYADRTSTVGNW